jgi:hypothetical protein
LIDFDDVKSNVHPLWNSEVKLLLEHEIEAMKLAGDGNEHVSP